MIKVTRLDDRVIIVNADLIEFIEETPDTIIKLTTGRHLMVKEKMEEVLNRIYEYRSKHPVYAIPAGGEIENRFNENK
ncbi:flagellar FlbD family protein [bacterium]|nr:flagellar FlbD family protein [bacterium]